MSLPSVRAFVDRHRTLAGFAAGVGVTAVVAGGGVALASIPSPTGAFSACVAKADGRVRIVDPSKGGKCTAAETATGWSRGLRYRGAWGAAATYAPGDVVYWTGASWVAKTASRNSRPVLGAAWGLLAARGATGLPGAAGAAGATGGRGPSDVYSVSKANPTGAAVPIAGAGYTTVLTLSIPAGVYLAQQSVEFNRGGTTGDAWCYLTSPTSGVTIANGADILTLASLTTTNQSPTTAAQGVVTATAASSLTLNCTGPTGSSIQRATVTALAVG
ncbi:MAG: hypothetical protein QOG49_96, partial [Frankiaceae bacterium]|nr:hypothetical protein [Frankiaceae bacterium]